MFGIALSTNGKPFGEELFAQYRAAGISAMELSFSKEKCDSFDFDTAAELSGKYGVELWSFHLPFCPFDEIDISADGLKKSTVAYFTGLIKKGAAAGIKRYVVHPSGEPIADGERDCRMKNAKESLAALAEEADKYGAVICVEDLPRSCLGRNSDEILELISADGRLKVCFDTNHLLNEDITDFISKTGKYIVTTHVSDYDFTDEKHWLPGEGKIDWAAVINALKKADYNGPWLYEVGFKAPKTMPRPRDLCCADFKQNAEALFEAAK